jgi:carboxyl-terminal processing protease
MDADLVELPTGAYLIYAAGEPRTPKGVVVEGRGVVPDIEVGLTRAGLLAGRDAQLEAAIERIKNCKR